MLIGELVKRTKSKRATIDRYVQLGLIPFKENPENGYREFDEEAVDQVKLIKILQGRPFKRDLKEIEHIFRHVATAELMAKKNVSNKELLHYLNERDLL
jgi:DNA-binding transcriptional MerR regulator